MARDYPSHCVSASLWSWAGGQWALLVGDRSSRVPQPPAPAPTITGLAPHPRLETRVALTLDCCRHETGEKAAVILSLQQQGGRGAGPGGGHHSSPSDRFGTCCGISLGKAELMESCPQEKSCLSSGSQVQAELGDTGGLPALRYSRGAHLTP